jgi:hypothetical protein
LCLLELCCDSSDPSPILPSSRTHLQRRQVCSVDQYRPPPHEDVYPHSKTGGIQVENYAKRFLLLDTALRSLLNTEMQVPRVINTAFGDDGSAGERLLPGHTLGMVQIHLPTVATTIHQRSYSTFPGRFRGIHLAPSSSSGALSSTPMAP